MNVPLNVGIFSKNVEIASLNIHVHTSTTLSVHFLDVSYCAVTCGLWLRASCPVDCLHKPSVKLRPDNLCDNTCMWSSLFFSLTIIDFTHFKLRVGIAPGLESMLEGGREMAAVMGR